MRVGLIGYPIKHSISPAFQQAAFDALGLDVRYEAWETPPELLETAIEWLRRDDCLGANVTIPHKTAIRSFLDDLDPTAEAVGAVNTIVKRSGRLIGFNTDIAGFGEALQRDACFDASGKDVVVLGAGGAARAVVASLLGASATSISIKARKIEQATVLIENLRRAGVANGRTRLTAGFLHDSPDLEELIRRAALLVNTTPVGMLHRAEAERIVVPATWLHSGLFVYDLVYNPAETPLLRAARESGCRTLNGLPMLLYQGAAAFEKWTGRQPPIPLMRHKALEALGV